MIGDEGKLRQILLNLLGNAVKFTEQGSVSLKVYWEDDSVHFEVSDTGYGIAAEELKNLFQPFVQTESGRKATEGTGLGLAIGKECIHLMGGDITVQSELGKGTAFNFYVKLSKLKGNEIIKERFNAIGLAPNQLLIRILVVDDVAENRAVIIKLLSPFGFKLREAVNGKEAVEIWQEWRPELTFMDIRMPVMDGYEATKLIRQSQNNGTKHGTKNVVIGLSASVFEHEKEAVFNAGCDDFIAKPFKADTLFDKMKEHLDINFIYEEVAPTSLIGEKKQTSLNKQKLINMPVKLINNLYDALITGNIEEALLVTEKIAKQDEALANELKFLIENFRFDELEKLITDVKQEAG